LGLRVLSMSAATSSRDRICGSFCGWRALGMSNWAAERLSVTR
jgi:hypothetical protein